MSSIGCAKFFKELIHVKLTRISDLLYLWYLFLSFCVQILKIKIAWNYDRESVCDFNFPKKIEKLKTEEVTGRLRPHVPFHGVFFNTSISWELKNRLDRGKDAQHRIQISRLHSPRKKLSLSICHLTPSILSWICSGPTSSDWCVQLILPSACLLTCVAVFCFIFMAHFPKYVPIPWGMCLILSITLSGW